MIKLEALEGLGRKIRRDDWGDLGTSTWSLVEQAILEGDDEAALELLDYLFIEGKMCHDFTSDMWAAMVTYVGSNFGEEEVEKVWRNTVSHTTLGSGATVGGALERVYVGAEIWRGHCVSDNQFKIVEYEDRYEFLFDPCPTGGRMRKRGMLDPPYNLGVTTKPYPWSWSREGIPWYCCHCSVCRGVMAVETAGYFVRVHEYPEGPDAVEGKCRLIFYKEPELVPEKYFKELGLRKNSPEPDAT
jgi:hypothetical protein